MPLFKIESSKKAYSLNSPEIINILTNQNNGYVSASQAMHNSDLYSLIWQLSSDIAVTQFHAETNRMQAMIDNPDSNTNGFSFWVFTAAQLLLNGQAFIYRRRNVNGVDMRWEGLRPSQVQTQMLEDGSGLVYNINFDEPDIEPLQNVPQGDVLHFRLLSKNGGKTGISPLMSLKDEFNIKDASNRLTLNSLSKSVEAPGILTIQGGGLLNWKKKAARSREFMKQVNSSDNGPVVLDDLESYQPLEIKSDVAKLLSQADWTGKQIAKVYGVPDSILNGQGDQQSSIAMMGGQYAKALNRYVKSITSELNAKLHTKIVADIRPAIDATGDQFADTIGSLAKNDVIAMNQATYVLQKAGYLPDRLPEAQLKGGESNEKDSDERNRNT